MGISDAMVVASEAAERWPTHIRTIRFWCDHREPERLPQLVDLLAKSLRVHSGTLTAMADAIPSTEPVEIAGYVAATAHLLSLNYTREFYYHLLQRTGRVGVRGRDSVQNEHWAAG